MHEESNGAALNERKTVPEEFLRRKRGQSEGPVW